MFWQILLVLIVFAVLVTVLRPLFGARPDWGVLSEPEIGEVLELLAQEKEQVLRKLKDLDLERESGAMGEEEYEELRRGYLREAALVNRRIDLVRESRRSPEPAPEKAGAAGGRS